EKLNERIDRLLSRPEFATFALIGSGLQHKHGQTTVARQDIHGSIPDDLSEEFLESVQSTVRDVDPEGTIFGVEDTGKDVEIMLTVDGGRRFSKGDGLSYLNDALGLGLSQSPCLICGDTSSDLPMVEKAVELGGRDRTAAVFVTRDEDLRRRVSAVLDRSHFVSTPDVLVAALHLLAVERGASH
ncbi:MAG: trehalose 6-phosphate synthase, partial [Spirochaetaceae bacterium]